jgi:hypothetical protein
MIDYTRLRKKIIPDPDGEPNLVLRTATIDAVNTDGTVDLEMSSGVIVPDIPQLQGSYAPAGAVVNVLSLRGSLLVIGASGLSSGTGGALIKTGVHTGGPSAAASYAANAISFGVTFPAAPNVHVNLASGLGAAASWVPKGKGITTTQFDLLAHGPSSTFTGDWQWTAVYSP